MSASIVIERSRFAFDLGTNSIGWAVYNLDQDNRPDDLIDCGVRLFSDGRNPKDGQSLAAMRRVPRAARKRRDRFIQRRQWLMTLLVRHGLMPMDEAERKALEALDPYSIRGRALGTRLEPHEIGRALFHLNQRRGYKSNRVTDAAADDKETGKIAASAAQLAAKLKEGGYETLGQFYAAKQAGPLEGRGVRARLRGKGAQAAYDFYPLREMLEEEFDRIWFFQAAHHPVLMTDRARTDIRNAIFHQRPLKPPVVGRCTFNAHEFRLASAQPLAQRFRIYQELANLKIEEGLDRPRVLTLAERDRLASPLLAGEDLTFGKIRKLLDLGGATRINLEEGGRDRLKGDATMARLGGKRGPLKSLWPRLSDVQKSEVIALLLEETDLGAATDALIERFGATPEEAEAAAKFRPPEGHIRLGPTATAKVVEALIQGDLQTGLTITYNDACLRAGFHHSDLRDGEIFDSLPDYRTVLERHTIGGTGAPEDPDERRLGRVPNPTVHIALNQLRRVMNALIDQYGPPGQVVLELARELKQTREDKEKAQKDNRRNEEANRKRAADLEEAGLEPSAANLRLYRLWEDLGANPRICTYTGKSMSFADVFSDRVEIEHILPFSRTLDDSMANKTVTFRDVNRGKRNLTPEEAFGPDKDLYEAIQLRAAALPPNKRWRFLPGAMERYDKEGRDFLARQLNETRHLSRLAREYVTKVTDPDHVWVVTGQLTALLRARWGLNFSNVKDRNNHRHHAIDAATIGVIDRGLLNELAHRAGVREGDDRLEEIVKDVPPPPGFVAAGRDFRLNVRERVQALIVSQKPEHGTGGALHEDTAYGLVDPASGEDGNLVYRKAIDALTPNEIERVRDLNLRSRLMDIREQVGGPKADAKALATALDNFGRVNNIRRVRLLKQETGVLLINDRRTGAAYKALIPGENHHMDIVEDSNGVWRGYAASVFEANQRSVAPAWQQELPGAKLIMRLHKGDMVEIADTDGIRLVKRVVRINPSGGRLYLAAHDEGGELAKRHADENDPFRWDLASVSRLKERGCRLVLFDAIGRQSWR